MKVFETNNNKRGLRHYLTIFCVVGIAVLLIIEFRSSFRVVVCNTQDYQLSQTKQYPMKKDDIAPTTTGVPTKSSTNNDFITTQPIDLITTPTVNPCFNKTKNESCRKENLTHSINATRQYEIFIQQQLRQQTLRNFCRHNRELAFQNGSLKYNLLYSDKESVVYCSVPKVACTNWKRVLRVFEGKLKYPLEIKQKHKVHLLNYPTLKKLSPKDQLWRLNLYYSFVFVRHPFERILSAYRNKFKDPYSPGFQRRYGPKILRLFREDLTEKEYKAGRNVTFEEFVRFIIHVHAHKGSKSFDEHWQIIHSLCKPCQIKYNYIGKMETLVDDAEQVLREIGADKKVKFPANAKDKYKKDVRTMMREYYAPLGRDILMRLYKIYEVDFLGFGYVFPDYLLTEEALGKVGNSTTV